MSATAERHIPNFSRTGQAASLTLWAALLSLTTFTSTAQTYSILHNFGGMTNSDGANPMGGLILLGNTLYGTTQGGGWSNLGTVFCINTDGSGHKVLKHFAGSDGARPESTLVIAGSTLYGTTRAGGGGTVFRMSSDGQDYTVLRMFDGASEGSLVNGHLLLSGTTLYGTAYAGGNSRKGTVFKLNTDGTGFVVLKHFAGGSDGDGPQGQLVLSGSTLYGTTRGGGLGSVGTVFRLSVDGGDYQVIKSFGGPDEGAHPHGGLLASGITLYGTTYGNPGLWYRGTVFAMNMDGSGFESLAFCDGATSVVRSGSVLYGTTSGGGQTVFKFGTLFKFDLVQRRYQMLKDFGLTSGSEGWNPEGEVVVSGSMLYGTAPLGGVFSNGVAFSVSLAPRLVYPACGGTNFSFAFQSEDGQSYIVECSDDPSTTNWLALQTLTGTGSPVFCCFPKTNATPSFFRLRQP